MAAGLKDELVAMPKTAKPTSKELQERTLQMIRKAVKADEAKRARDEATGLGIKRGSAQPN